MKKFAVVVFVFAVVGISLGAMYITENCAMVTGALNELKFEQQHGSTKMVGGPQSFKVTKATIDYLQQLQKDGKTIEVGNDGAIKIK